MKKKLQILLFFGSFNPIHKGHIHLAEIALKAFDFDELWFVLSPQNPFKNETELLSETDRAAMIELSIKDKHHFKLSTIESEMSKPSFTIQTLEKLYSIYPNTQFDILMGEDNLNDFYKWKSSEKILALSTLYVYPRKSANSNTNTTLPPHIYLNAELLPISSTQIREKWMNNETISPFMKKEAANYLTKIKSKYI